MILAVFAEENGGTNESAVNDTAVQTNRSAALAAQTTRRVVSLNPSGGAGSVSTPCPIVRPLWPHLARTATGGCRLLAARLQWAVLYRVLSLCRRRSGWCSQPLDTAAERFVNDPFRAACLAMGVNFQPTHEASPWEKGTVERTFASIASMFAQYVAGYVGRSVDRRGKNAEKAAVWSIVELQDLLDEWIVACWQNRPHDGLRHPLSPGAVLTPNEQYAALLEVTGFVPVPLSAEDYIELLPVTWRVISAYGIKMNRRTYDCAALNPHRGQSSGVAAQKGRWEIHYDPYDVTRVWVRNHLDGGWITVAWTHLRNTPTPFGEAAWSQAREILSRRGSDPVTEIEIAGAVEALLDKAEQGPAREPAAAPATKPTKTKRDRRVAARTRATTEPNWPRPVADPEPEPVEILNVNGADEEDRLAAVIPLAVFDAREEAKKWW